MLTGRPLGRRRSQWRWRRCSVDWPAGRWAGGEASGNGGGAVLTGRPAVGQKEKPVAMAAVQC